MFEVKDYWDVYGNPTEAYKHIRKLEAEIERQRALIERAKPFVQAASDGSHSGSLFDMQCKKWLKDAGGECKITPVPMPSGGAPCRKI